jgi:hypothetical protein
MGKLDALSRRLDHGDGKRDNADVVFLKPELFIIRALEGIKVEGEEKEILRDIQRLMQKEEKKDVMVKVAEMIGKVKERLV